MKLVELAADRTTFRPIRFNPVGLTIVVGDAAEDDSKEGSSNGVGKTLALGLVHHLLGAKTNKKLARAVPDWMFRLTFTIGGREHVAERSGDGKRLFLDGQRISQVGYREWLDDSGAFRIDPNAPNLSFRALFKRFARHLRDDCIDPVRTHKEQEADSLIYSLYLLGADITLAVSKRQIRIESEKLRESANAWRDDPLLKEVLRTGLQPKLRMDKLDRDIADLRAKLEQFQVAADYRQLEQKANELTASMRANEKEVAVRRFQIEGIDRSLQVQPDISRADLMNLYAGLQDTFRSEVLRHFEAVEQFHESLSGLRRARLQRDRVLLQSQMRDLETQLRETEKERDAQLASLQGKRALDEYAAVAKQAASLEEEHARLSKYLGLTQEVQEQQQRLRERLVEEDRATTDYLATDPIRVSNERFQRLAEILYPKAPSGILLENNLGHKNQKRYDLLVRIEGDDSDGINAARILCFDWLVLMNGSNHTMDFVWHDNRVFAHIDPAARARWFAAAEAVSVNSGKQYIASINTENFLTMQQHLDTGTWGRLSSAVVLTLRGDKPSNKLLGIQFGGS